MRLSATILSVLLLASPSLAQSPPDPTESKYFTTFGGGIALDPGTQPLKIFYALTLQLRQNIPSGAVAVADFENPENAGKPLQATHVFTTPKNRITLLSPNLSCVTNGRNYRVLVTLYTDAKRTRILGTHEQFVNFRLPPAQLQQLNIRQC
jgi:hypothetical protein